ncbi:hypothetical protein B0F87_101348 [Methylobacter tundripaludum]|uniref:Uncharacterized protein n=1 Tax=Methylobacter tundripaludum TaxID=173365 RepID=A0A2S6HKK9_9GAMM|nr:hypothetical protein B0F87_101348 [Methylobacter tundripaludum]
MQNLSRPASSCYNGAFKSNRFNRNRHDALSSYLVKYARRLLCKAVNASNQRNKIACQLISDVTHCPRKARKTRKNRGPYVSLLTVCIFLILSMGFTYCSCTRFFSCFLCLSWTTLFYLGTCVTSVNIIKQAVSNYLSGFIVIFLTGISPAVYAQDLLEVYESWRCRMILF